MSAPVVPGQALADRPRGHLRSALGGTRELVRIAYRDPEHVPERLTLLATQNLAAPSSEWAAAVRRERPDASPAELAGELRRQSARIARVDGAVAGTPFFIALVPGYVSYLWQEARMTLRTAALFGRDPAALHTAAELLALRGVHPTVEQARAALLAVPEVPPPVEERRPLRTWVHSARVLLVFGGFLGPPNRERPSGAAAWARAAGGAMAGAALWITTWVLPLTFMIAMAWGCETHARRLGLRTLALYGGTAAPADEGHTRRQVVRGVALSLSIAIPIAFVAWANHVRQETGISWVAAVGALVALSLVIAGAMYGSRR
jgi:hypothetical protein